MNKKPIRALLLGAALTLGGVQAFAQTPTPYGAPVTLEQARKALAAAESEALKNN